MTVTAKTVVLKPYDIYINLLAKLPGPLQYVTKLLVLLAGGVVTVAGLYDGWPKWVVPIIVGATAVVHYLTPDSTVPPSVVSAVTEADDLITKLYDELVGTHRELAGLKSVKAVENPAVEKPVPVGQEVNTTT